jgi:hypothetical protein
MSLKAELEAWAAASKAYDEEDFERALELFSVCVNWTIAADFALLTSQGHRRFLQDTHEHGAYICHSR